MTSGLANSLVSIRKPQIQFLSGFSLMQANQCFSFSSLVISPLHSGDDGRPSGASIFVGGFVLGGIVVGTLGCIYTPQISKALTGAERKDLMRKLPKFIYDEESFGDDVSSQLCADDEPNGVAVTPDELEAST